MPVCVFSCKLSSINELSLIKPIDIHASKRYNVIMHFVLVDFNNIFFRAHFIGDKIYTSNKYPIGAAFACVHYLSRLSRTLGPSHIALLRDMGKQTWRHQLYPSYKQHRSKTEPELSAQFCLAPFIAEYLKMPLIGFHEYEADDCIATLAVHAQKFAQITIISTDKDLFQLLNDKTRIYNPHTKEFHYADHINTKFQIKPGQMCDYLALIGDTADNLPGIPGIGAKTAVDILQHCQTTSDIYNNLHLYTASAQTKLKGNHSQFQLMHRLVHLSTDIPELCVQNITDMDMYKYTKIYAGSDVQDYLETKITANNLQPPAELLVTI